MRIQRSRIRNLENYLNHISTGQSFRVAIRVEDAKMTERLGLGSDPGSGETILPAIVGPITRFNAEGRWQALKDLPKETRYIRTIWWRWTTWDGDEHEEFKDVFRECYQRDLIPPPAVELSYIESGEGNFIISSVLERRSEQAELTLHTINVFLELYRTCEIVSADLQQIELPEVKKANWRLLPPGEYPWDKVDDHVGHAVRRLSERTAGVILDRKEMLKSLRPDECWVGEGGFEDYMVYVFNSHELIVMESLRRDNALYIFTGDWRPVSKLSKAQIIQNGLHLARIIHTKDWKGKLISYFKRRAA